MSEVKPLSVINGKTLLVLDVEPPSGFMQAGYLEGGSISNE